MFPVEKMCEVLRLSRSSYYRWKKCKSSNREEENKVLEKMITEIYLKSRGTHGSPRISRELKALGFPVSKPRVARLTESNGIQSKIRKKWKVTTNSNHIYPIIYNKLNREFTTEKPNEVYLRCCFAVGVRHYIYRNKRRVDLLDRDFGLRDRKIIGWALSKTMYTKDTVVPAWKMANDNRKIDSLLIFHSD